MPETSGQFPKPTIEKDLFSLRTAAEKLRAYKALIGQPETLKSKLNEGIKRARQGDKMMRSEVLTTREELVELIDQVGKIRDLVFKHGGDEVEYEKGEAARYKKLSFGKFSVFCDLEDSVDDDYLSFTANDEKNKAEIDLTVNKDMKSYEFTANFINTEGRIDVKFNSGDKALEEMTDIEYRILMHYMREYVKYFDELPPELQ